MTDTAESSGFSSTRLAALSTTGKIRFASFTLVATVIIVLNVALTPSYLLAAPFIGWFQDMGVHQVHDMTVGALVWLAFILPMALHLYHPAGRINTILPPLVAAVAIAGLAFLADSFLFMGFMTMTVLVVIALVLHPAGRSLRRFDGVEAIDRRVAGLFTIGAIPLLVYAGLELDRQVGPVDEHVVFVHYGGMAIAAFLVVLMGFLAILRRRDRRFALWNAGLMAAFIGLVSVIYPDRASSLGPIAGSLLFLWAIGLVVSVEYVWREAAKRAGTGDERVAEPV